MAEKADLVAPPVALTVSAPNWPTVLAVGRLLHTELPRSPKALAELLKRLEAARAMTESLSEWSWIEEPRRCESRYQRAVPAARVPAAPVRIGNLELTELTGSRKQLRIHPRASGVVSVVLSR